MTTASIDLVKDTFNNFNAVEGIDDVKAQPGDRITMMDMTGETDVLVVLLAKKTTVVAQALTEFTGSVAVGGKYRLPLKYCSLGLPDGATQLMLYKVSKPAASAEVKPARTPRVKPVEGGKTKIQMCREIFAANPGAVKADVVALFISEAKCTKMGANTYYITCDKEANH